MIIRLILLALLLPALANAGQGMCPGPGFKTYSAGSTCSTQTTIYDYTAQGTNTGNVYDTVIKSFIIVGTGKALYSVELYTGSSTQGTATSGKFKILVSTNNDFSGTLTDEFFISTPGTISTKFSANSSSQPVLANGTTYYVGLYGNNATYGERVTLSLDSESGKNTYNVSAIGGTVTTPNGNYTPMGEIKVCD